MLPSATSSWPGCSPPPSSPPLPRKDKVVFYNSIHSYSQLILLPWGFQQETPADYDEMCGAALVLLSQSSSLRLAGTPWP
jgi:hypothetical protein